MRSQIEKNKEILCEEMEKLGEGKMTESVAVKLGVYKNAYKALCMVQKEQNRVSARSDSWHHDMDETPYQHGIDRLNGYGSGSGAVPFTQGLAQEWVQKMKNADGTTGPHWTMEKTEEARAQRGISCDPLAFWVAMNMIYSDYAKVAEKVNANSMDFYVYMAKAFLEDEDARNQGGEKLARYYEYVVL